MSFEIAGRHLSALEPSESVDFVDHLINAEGNRLGIPPTQVKTVPFSTTSEGGVDGYQQDFK